MHSFFWRVMLGVWVVIIATIWVTVFVTSELSRERRLDDMEILRINELKTEIRRLLELQDDSRLAKLLLAYPGGQS